ncbi:PHO85 cyclin-5, partial [Coemansia sp. Benny D160-2]
ITCVIIESIWPHHSVSHRTQLCSLRCFVAETHRQSRLTLDALELCMFYLLRAKSIIQAKQRAAKQREERQEQQEQQEQVQKAAAAAAVQQQNAVGMTLPLTPRSPQSSAGGAPKTGNVVAVAAGGSATSSAVMVVPGGSSTSSSSSTDRLISPTDSSPFTPVSAQQMGHGIGFVGMMDKHHLLANDMITHHGHNLNQLDSADPKAIIGSKQYQQRAIAGSTGTLPLSYRSFVAAAANKQPQMQTQVQQQPGKETITTTTNTTTTTTTISTTSTTTANTGSVGLSEKGKPPKPNTTKCGRRMFVAALICASKFMYDRTYSNKAWNKITKLPLAQISDMERAFLDMIDYRLYVDLGTYDRFHRLLARSGMRNGRLMICDQLSAASPASSASSSPTVVGSATGAAAATATGGVVSGSPLPLQLQPTSPPSAASYAVPSPGNGAPPPPPPLAMSAEQQQQLIKAPRINSISHLSSWSSVSSTPISPTAVVPGSTDLRGPVVVSATAASGSVNVPLSLPSVYQQSQMAAGIG